MCVCNVYSYMWLVVYLERISKFCSTFSFGNLLLIWSSCTTLVGRTIGCCYRNRGCQCYVAATVRLLQKTSLLFFLATSKNVPTYCFYYCGQMGDLCKQWEKRVNFMHVPRSSCNSSCNRIKQAKSVKHCLHKIGPNQTSQYNYSSSERWIGTLIQKK